MFGINHLRNVSDETLQKDLARYQDLLDYLARNNNELPSGVRDYCWDPHSAEYPLGYGFFYDGSIKYGHYEKVPGYGYAHISDKSIAFFKKEVEAITNEIMRRSKVKKRKR